VFGPMPRAGQSAALGSPQPERVRKTPGILFARAGRSGGILQPETPDPIHDLLARDLGDYGHLSESVEFLGMSARTLTQIGV
jgi:hypothetical protein